MYCDYDYDFEVMLCDVVGNKVITLECGIKPNGNPIYRVTVFSGKKRVESIYNKNKTAYSTYKLLLRVSAMD